METLNQGKNIITKLSILLLEEIIKQVVMQQETDVLNVKLRYDS